MFKFQNNEKTSIINFNNLVDLTIKKLLDNNTSNLSKAHIKILKKITPVQTKVLGEALRLATKDGLNENEIRDIINDLYDLVDEASSKRSFDKLMKNPYNAKFKLTPEVSEAIKNLKIEDKNQLLMDLEVQSPELKDKFLGFFNEIQSVAFPIVKSVILEIVSSSLMILGRLINGNIDNPIGDILEEGLNNLSLSLHNTSSEVKQDASDSATLIGATSEHDLS